MQAQLPSAAALALRPRSAAPLTAGSLEQARAEERSVVRLWALRGTLHVVATEDAGWLVGLLGPVFIRRSRRRLAELDLDEPRLRRGLEALTRLLEGGPRTRAQVVEELRRQDVPAGGQAPIHLIGRAALEGLVCLGPTLDGEESYVLATDWIGRRAPVDRDVALAELARRYLAAHAPAAPADFAVWSGLPLRDAAAAWERLAPELIEVRLQEGPAWMLAAQPPAARVPGPASPAPVVHLLPHFDPYLLGYRDRALALAPRFARRVQAGGGFIAPTLVVDGRVLGVWRVDRRRRAPELVIQPFEELDPASAPGLHAQVLDVARFLGVEPLTRVEAPQ